MKEEQRKYIVELLKNKWDAHPQDLSLAIEALLEEVDALEGLVYGIDDSYSLTDYKRDCFEQQKEIAKLVRRAEAWKAAAEAAWLACIGIPEQYADAGYEINKALKHAYWIEGNE